METNTLQIREPQQWLAAQGRTEAELQILRRFICVDFKGQAPTDGELMFFMLYCNQHGLDPFSRQAHLLKTKNGPQVCLGIDGMRLRAAQSGEYAGQDEPIFEFDARGTPILCKVTVYRFVGGQRVPFPAIAWMSESRGGSPIWSQRPQGMLEKCAEAKALRKGFPDRCGAFYTPDEIDGQGNEPAKPVASAADLNARLSLKQAPVVEAEVVEEEPSPDLDKLIGAFQKIGVSEAAWREYLGKPDTGTITPGDIERLRAWYRHLTEERQ